MLLYIIAVPLFAFTQNDSLTLIQFQDMDGENWTNQWDFSQPMNTWYGVDATGDKRHLPVCPVGTNFSHRFLIDTAIENKTFRFFKNGANWKSDTIGLLAFNNFTIRDTGVYHVEITHLDAPDLTLESYRLTLTTEVTTSNTLTSKQDIIKFHPNPASAYLKIESVSFPDQEIQIMDIFGKLWLRQNVPENLKISLQNMPAGLYILTIGNRRSIKFIKK